MGLIEETPTEKIIKPHPYQVILALAKQKEVIASTGQGSGKTSFAPVLLMLKMAQYEKPGEYLFVEPTYGMVEKVAIPTFEKTVKDTYFEGRWYNKKDKIYQNRFGKIYFLSAEKPKHIQGIHARLAIIDEGGQVSREAYYMIRGRTNLENGQVYILTNPYRGKDPYIYTELLERWKAGDPNILFLFFNSLVNPSFNKERYEADKKILTKEEFEFQYGGRYSKPKGLIYEYDDRDVVKDVQYNGEPCYAGVDFGISDPTVVEIAFVNTTGIHIIHEYDRTNIEYSSHAKPFGELQKKYNIKMWFPDYEGVGTAAVMEINKETKRLGLPKLNWKHAEKDVIKGVQAVQRQYRRKRLTISPSCRRLLAENAGWLWTRDGRPKDKDDHAETAVRLLVTGIDEYLPKLERTPMTKRLPSGILEETWAKIIKSMEGKNQKTNWLNKK